MPNQAEVFLNWLGQQSLLEALSAAEHERWSHWQRYLHAQCTTTEDGSLVIPANLVERWTQQMSTPYEELSDKEKESDREQAREYLDLIREEFSSTYRSD